EDERMGRISGYGWAIGYLGGLAALLLAYPFTSAGLAEGADRYRVSFLVVALFHLVFTLPILVLLKERAPRRPERLRALSREALRRLRDTFRHVRALRDLFRFLLAFLVYNDAVTTVIAFSAIYAMHVIGFTVHQVMMLFIVTQITAFAGTFAAGFLVDRWGAKPTILATLVLWIGTIAGAWAARGVGPFFAVAILASIGMGSTQTASRSLMGLLVPPGRSAEFFGFFALTGKVSAVVGPLLYGSIASAFGSERPAVLSLSVIVLAGLLLMLGVDVDRGRRAAERAAPPPGAPSGRPRDDGL
ncbi:MAG TPA: MFS transporter, partial [Candidatus Binatia bacterium]|nr:MFS transporter [Candidatus Binatia bacterium]